VSDRCVQEAWSLSRESSITGAMARMTEDTYNASRSMGRNVSVECQRVTIAYIGHGMTYLVDPVPAGSLI
jgi:hypothetical protein